MARKKVEQAGEHVRRRYLKKSKEAAPAEEQTPGTPATATPLWYMGSGAKLPPGPPPAPPLPRRPPTTIEGWVDCIRIVNDWKVADKWKGFFYMIVLTGWIGWLENQGGNE